MLRKYFALVIWFQKYFETKQACTVLENHLHVIETT